LVVTLAGAVIEKVEFVRVMATGVVVFAVTRTLVACPLPRSSAYPEPRFTPASTMTVYESGATVREPPDEARFASE